MDPFDRARLSPLPRQAQPCPLPYDLTWQELSLALPDFEHSQSAQAQAFLSHQKQGLNGGDNSCILTLHYPINMAGVSSTRSQTVFIKHTHDPLKAEAEKYRFLSAHGIPVPHLLAALTHGESEIILLEFLATIGIDFHSSDEVNSLLDLVARLNAVQNPLALFKPRPGIPQAEFDASVRAALSEQTHEQEADACYAAYLSAQEAAKTMPTALNHNQLYFQQMGWAARENGRELVLFDLETMVICPRFADIAGILFSLEAVCGKPQEDLFQTYLQRLSHYSGASLRFDEALRELRLLRVREGCYNLPWLSAGSACSADDSASTDLRAQLAMTMRCLREDLAALAR